MSRSDEYYKGVVAGGAFGLMLGMTTVFTLVTVGIAAFCVIVPLTHGEWVLGILTGYLTLMSASIARKLGKDVEREHTALDEVTR